MNGETTRQMKNAPSGSAFVWVNADLRYPRELAEALRRQDLQIFSPLKVGNFGLRGKLLSAVIVDHAAELTERQWDEVTAARECALIRQRNTI